jgi:hypothetical protein
MVGRSVVGRLVVGHLSTETATEEGVRAGSVTAVFSSQTDQRNWRLVSHI